MIYIDTIQDLLNLPRQGIYCLVNHATKRFLVCQTPNSIMGVARILNQIQTGSYPIKDLCNEKYNLSINWLETNKNSLYRNFHVEYWVKHFESLGYINYRTRPYKRFKAKIDYILTSQDNSPVPLGVCIKLYTHSKIHGIMGIWQTVEEAEAFLKYYYTDQDLIMPAYATNKESIEYFKTGLVNGLQIE